MNTKTARPAVAMTVVSMVLTLAVVMMWLGQVLPWPIALVIGLGIDGGWLTTLAYERRLAAQGDHNAAVTGVGWGFGLMATGVLVAHAMGQASPAAWLAVSWLPLGAKALWLIHGMWERTALSPSALQVIQTVLQESRDEAAVARAQLNAEARTEETRLTSVAAAGSRVARVQVRSSERLSTAWNGLKGANNVMPDRGVTPRWELPIWGPMEPVKVELDPVDKTPALPVAKRVDDEAVSTFTTQVSDVARPVSKGVDKGAARLDGKAARAAIETAWKEGLTTREAAVRATRSSTYVGKVYGQLNNALGHQPSKGQMRIA